MFGMYPKPPKYKSTTVQYLCEHIGSILVSYMLNLQNPKLVYDFDDNTNDALNLAYCLYTKRVIDCGVGIAMIQFTASGRDGVSVAEAIRDGNFEDAERYSQWWYDIESGRLDEMGQ